MIITRSARRMSFYAVFTSGRKPLTPLLRGATIRNDWQLSPSPFGRGGCKSENSADQFCLLVRECVPEHHHVTIGAASGPHTLQRPIIHSITYRHVLPINGVSAEQAPRRRPDWGFSSVAEANLFRIRGITGVADTEASNMQALGEEKGRGEERRAEGVQGMCWQGVDCVLAGVWSLVMVWIYNWWLSWESTIWEPYVVV